MLWHRTFSIVVLLRQPWQMTSPAAVVWRAATALANSALRSKLPPTHSPLGQSNRNRDFAWARLTVYFISPVLIWRCESRCARSTVKDFNSRNFSARLTESLMRWLSWRRYSARGLIFRCFIIY